MPIEIRIQDYRDVHDEAFDHIVSIAMLEAVGYKNFDAYMNIVSENLKDDGLFLLHTMGDNVSVKNCDPWFDKYIFHHGMLPSIAQLGRSMENLFVVEDWHNFGFFYARTLQAWHKNFIASWPTLKDSYGSRFRRMWEYYLLSLVGVFRAREIQLWQIVMSKHGVPGGYSRPTLKRLDLELRHPQSPSGELGLADAAP